nr:hypothetical protein [Tanacetum cinerariifolium]
MLDHQDKYMMKAQVNWFQSTTTISLPNKDPYLSFHIIFAISTQQDIYAAGSENRPPMLNKENYVPWSSRLLQYAKSRPNGKLIHNSIINGPYVRRMIPEPDDPNREVPVNETFHVQTDDELTEKELKQIEVDDQAIQAILLGLPEDIYAAVDSCETAQEIWLRVQQMMKGSDIGILEKKAKLFNEWERIQNVGNQNGLIGVPENANQNPNRNGNLIAARAESNATGHNGNQIRCYNYRGLGHFTRNCTARPKRKDDAYLQTQLLIAQKEEAGIQLQAKEFDLMATAVDLDEIDEVNANYIFMANLQQTSTSGTQTDKAPVYDSDGSAEVHNYEDCYDNEIFNMFTQEEQYTKLLEPIPEPHQVPQNDNNIISKGSSMEQSGGTVEQHHANIEETAFSGKSTVSSLFEEKKKWKSDFKIRDDELVKKQIQFEKKIKELDNILVTAGQSIQTIYMLSPKPDSFYHTEQKMALGYQNPFYLKQAQQKPQSLYKGKVLFEKHDPPVVHDSKETLQLAQESRQKMKQLNKEINQQIIQRLIIFQGFLFLKWPSHMKSYIFQIHRNLALIPQDRLIISTSMNTKKKEDLREVKN